MSEKEDLTKINIGERHYKAYVGPPTSYDTIGAQQFRLLTSLGLRAEHKLLDIGCGSLRLGKLLIPYLDKNSYKGIEPNQWLLDEAIEKEIGTELIDLKKVEFSNSSDFELSVFNVKFDFIVAQSIFSHASSAQINLCFGNITDVLLEDGLFLATFLVGHEDYEGDEWIYPACVTFRKSFIADLAKKHDLRYTQLDWNHMNGQTWFAFYKPASATFLSPILSNIHKIDKSKKSLRSFIKKSSFFNNSFTRSIYRKLSGE